MEVPSNQSSSSAYSVVPATPPIMDHVHGNQTLVNVDGPESDGFDFKATLEEDLNEHKQSGYLDYFYSMQIDFDVSNSRQWSNYAHCIHGRFSHSGARIYLRPCISPTESDRERCWHIAPLSAYHFFCPQPSKCLEHPNAIAEASAIKHDLA